MNEVYCLFLFFLFALLEKVQRYIYSQQNSQSTIERYNQNPVPKIAMEYYKMPSEDIPIVFIDSIPEYERFIHRLFNDNNEELFIGFDCMLFS